MKKLQMILLFLFSTACIFSQQTAFTSTGEKVFLHSDGTWEMAPEMESSFVFRGNSWGDGKEEVKNKETSALKAEDDDFLGYNGQVGSLNCAIIYSFVQNQMIRAKYFFTESHSNKTDYVSDYRKIKALLTEKFGTPTEDDVFWKNDLYKDDPSHYGLAVSIGHLVYECVWELEDTKVLFQLTGDNYEISHAVQYSSKELAGLEASALKQNTMDQL